MATASVQVALLDQLRTQPTGYIPSAPDLSAVTSVVDNPQRRSNLLIDWVVETATDLQMEAASATLAG